MSILNNSKSMDTWKTWATHIFGATFLVNSLYLLHLSLPACFTITIVVSLLKETADLFIETPQVSGGLQGSITDFFGWAIGAIAQTLLLHFFT